MSTIQSICNNISVWQRLFHSEKEKWKFLYYRAFLVKKEFTGVFFLLFCLIKAPTGNNCQKNRNRIVSFRAAITNKIFTRLRWMGYWRSCVIQSIKTGSLLLERIWRGLIRLYYCLLNAVVHKFYCGTAASDWYSIF